MIKARSHDNNNLLFAVSIPSDTQIRTLVFTNLRLTSLIQFSKSTCIPRAGALESAICVAALRGSSPEAPEIGGADGDRTHDLRLAKPALSQLSYGPVMTLGGLEWWAWKDLNFRPHAYQACALTN
jgi:hypothetical protein